MNGQSRTNQELIEENAQLKQRIQELEPSEEARKQAERRQNLAIEILGILNDPSELTDSINLILTAIKYDTGFDAVGIRLRSGDDFPYFVQNGFSHDFLLTENTLIARDASGTPCKDEKGDISLECTCGLVISGQTDPTNPLFTEAGSSWTNNSLPFLDLPAEQDPRLHPRNNCIHQGYLSVALIPIRANREIVGLLQLNDREKDRFTLDMIHFFEGISASIGVALLRKRAEEALRESERRYRELSIIDDLTQLYNSRHFYDQLRMETARADRYGQPLSLMLLDLDDFKRFNDTYGHIEGDQVLARLGKVVKRCLRQMDTAYRYGGEEFIILLPATTNEGGAVIAERIRMEFKQETFSPAPGQNVHVTVSVGLAQYKPQEDIKAFIRRADQLMYQGKRTGKDRLCFES